MEDPQKEASASDIELAEFLARINKGLTDRKLVVKLAQEVLPSVSDPKARRIIEKIIGVSSSDNSEDVYPFHEDGS